MRSRNRRILDDLDEKPGLGEVALAANKEEAESRMRNHDRYPKPWRELYILFDPRDVNACHIHNPADPDFARFAIERKRGKAI